MNALLQYVGEGVNEETLNRSRTVGSASIPRQKVTEVQSLLSCRHVFSDHSRNSVALDEVGNRQFGLETGVQWSSARFGRHHLHSRNSPISVSSTLVIQKSKSVALEHETYGLVMTIWLVVACRNGVRPQVKANCRSRSILDLRQRQSDSLAEEVVS